MLITLIRHLPTEWNKLQKLQGRKDIDICPISPEQRERISANKKLLKETEPFDLVLASTLNRTHQTAQLYGYAPETEKLLDELDFGIYEGALKEQLWLGLGEKWVERPRELVLGESMVSFENRILSFLDKYHGFTNILVFGHGSWIRGILSYYYYGDINRMNKMTVENNQCTTIRFDF